MPCAVQTDHAVMLFHLWSQAIYQASLKLPLLGQTCIQTGHAWVHMSMAMTVLFLQAAKDRAASRQAGQVVRRKVQSAAAKLVMMYISNDEFR